MTVSCDVCSSVIIRHLITFRDFFTSILNMKFCGSISFSVVFLFDFRVVFINAH